MADDNIGFGPVRRWKDEHGILHAENDIIHMAYVATDDISKLQGFALGFHGPYQVCVEYITHEQAKACNK